MAFQIGAQHYLYLAYDSVTVPRTVDALIDTAGAPVGSGTVTINTIDAETPSKLKLADLIKDVTVGGSNNTVDVTTRQTARQGFSASIIATSDSNMQVQFAYEPRSTAGPNPYLREDLGILQYCFATKKTIYAIDLDASKATGGAQGVGANWSIGFSTPKEVQGQVVMDVEFALESYAQIVFYNSTDTEFQAIA